MKKIKSLLVLCYLIVITSFLVSCGVNLPTKASKLKDPYVVTSISYFDKDNGICKYHISTDAFYIKYTDNIDFIDSVGKFSIGDTVIITFNKYK